MKTLCLLIIASGCASSGCASPTLPAPADLRQERVISPAEEELACPESGLADARPPAFLLQAGVGCDADSESYCFALSDELRQTAALGDPMLALERAAAAAEDYIAWGDGVDLARAIALADLSVSGAQSYLAFVNARPQVGSLGASREAETLVLERAYRVAWALRGPPSHRANARDALGWVAVSAEDDTPGRPVNMHGAPWPQHDVQLSVALGDGTPRPLRTRVVVASTSVPLEAPVPARLLGTIPPAPPISIPESGDVFLFVHGHTSLAEEGAPLIAALLEEYRSLGRELTVVAIDLPSNSYSERIDPEEVIGADTGSEGAVLRFLDRYLVALVHHLGIGERLEAVIGGSLGGNLALRIAEADLPWPRRVVAWSPASVDHSWELARLPLTAGEGEFTDIIKHEAVRMTRDASQAPGDDDSREDFFVDGPLSIRSQAGYWYRPDWQPCNDRFVEEGLLQVGEVYDDRLRRWHYRVAYEQLVFSHLALDPETGLRNYERIRAPLLLLTGDADNAIPMTTYDHVRRLSRHLSVEGTTLLLANTGHAMHSERPVLIAAEIASFVTER